LCGREIRRNFPSKANISETKNTTIRGKNFKGIQKFEIKAKEGIVTDNEYLENCDYD
jgi:hypothetical protein